MLEVQLLLLPTMSVVQETPWVMLGFAAAYFPHEFQIILHFRSTLQVVVVINTPRYAIIAMFLQPP
jgi:hypothetical protein